MNSLVNIEKSWVEPGDEAVPRVGLMHNIIALTIVGDP